MQTLSLRADLPCSSQLKLAFVPTADDTFDTILTHAQARIALNKVGCRLVHVLAELVSGSRQAFLPHDNLVPKQNVQGCVLLRLLVIESAISMICKCRLLRRRHSHVNASLLMMGVGIAFGHIAIFITASRSTLEVSVVL
jgi:hypothetical protein